MKLNLASVAFVSIAVVGSAAFLLQRPTAHDNQESILLLYAAGLRDPVRQTIDDYHREFPNVRVDVVPSGSGQLMAKVLAGEQGDLFLAADSSYVDTAYEKGAIGERLPVAVQMPVIAVRKNSQLAINGLDSLLLDDLRIGLGNPHGPATGKATKQILQRAGIWNQVKTAVEERGVFKPTVQDLATDLKLGAIDVAIMLDGTVAQHPELRAIPFPTEINVPLDISIGMMTTTKNPTRALHFARYLTTRDRGLKNFEAYGYGVVDGEHWADVPLMLQNDSQSP